MRLLLAVGGSGHCPGAKPRIVQGEAGCHYGLPIRNLGKRHGVVGVAMRLRFREQRGVALRLSVGPVSRRLPFLTLG